MSPDSGDADPRTRVTPPEGGRSRLRLILLAILLLGMAGTGTELFLLEHTEDWKQLIPLVGLGVGLLVAGTIAIRPRPASIRILRALMVAFVASGILGIYFHFRGNVEFELEIFPSSSGLPLVWEALRGATPALAPGAMVQLGLLGLAYTYRHPLLRADASDRRSASTEGATPDPSSPPLTATPHRELERRA